MAQNHASRLTPGDGKSEAKPLVISFEPAGPAPHPPGQTNGRSPNSRPRGLGDQVAALEREVERLREVEVALLQSNDALTLLSETANELLSSEKPQEVISKLFQKLSARLGLEAYFNYMVDEERGKLHLNSYAGISPEAAREIEWLEFGQAVCGCVARDACRIVAEDIQASDDIRTDVVRAFGITAYACHPLVARGNVVGTFSFGTSRKAQFEPHELALMQAVCDQVSMAMERTLLVSELRKRESAQRLLADASARLFSSLDYRGAISEFANLMVEQMSDWCVVDIRGEKGGFSRVVAVRDGSRLEDVARRLEASDLVARDEVEALSRVLETGQPELFSDLSDHAMIELTGHAQEARRLFSLGVSSAIVLPLVGRQGKLGTVMLVAAGSSSHFGPEELSLARELAYRTAISIENSRLYTQAREAARMRDDFLSVAAHELKTPITSLRGFAQTLLRQIAHGSRLDDSRSQRALEVINEQSIKLSGLISQLLDVSRLGAGQLALERRTVEFGDLVRGVVETFQMTLSDRQLALRVHEPVWITADPLRLEQVVRNLLDNAAKYSPEGGRIDIDVWSPEIGVVKLAVRDRGPGIPPEHREHVFDQFYQVQSTSYSGGMGLGLYISRQIVEMHSGGIELESPSDGGTRMVVSLPTALADIKRQLTEQEGRSI